MKAFETALHGFVTQQPRRFAEIFQHITETEANE